MAECARTREGTPFPRGGESAFMPPAGCGVTRVCQPGTRPQPARVPASRAGGEPPPAPPARVRAGHTRAHPRLSAGALPLPRCGGMRRGAAACWAVMLLAAAFCDTAAGKGGRGGARGAARGGARGAARGRVRAAPPRYGSAGAALRVAGAAAAGAAAGVAAGAALRRARLAGELESGDGVEYRDGNWTGAAGAWTSAAPARDPPGWAVPWLCPLAAVLRR
ncbi:shadow of prion protein [Falco rusticolus]|uniref:shadow of prion protein n=1 Tax=Falco rusticolus TaxID=120794 RepID=UPI0018868C9C|nr:shadow of prion protein [Falco rusticolus]XP_055575988.1 shadow of prion protein [Falco cherrug]XP_055656258.1 shadow of prion protein [Falco peregrinus]